MSGRRAYTVIKGFVNREWERLFESEDEDARREVLTTWAESGKEDGDAKVIHLERVSDGSRAPAISALQQPSKVDTVAKSRGVLGVQEKSSIEEIYKAYMSLIDRCNPSRFPDGSQEAFRANQIRIRVLEAYRTLTDHVDTTELRFRSIDLD